jgi:Zn ribbon nucleic-acid-binding protein
MAIIHMASVANALKKKSARTCPACQATQQVLKEYDREKVVCMKCGGSIPPQPESTDASR